MAIKRKDVIGVSIWTRLPRLSVVVAAFLFVFALTALPPAAMAATVFGSVHLDAILAQNLAVGFNFAVLPDQVTVYRHRNYDYAEIALIYGFAAESHRPVDEIIFLREHRHMGWGRMAQYLHVDLERVRIRTERVMHRHREFWGEEERVRTMVERERHYDYVLKKRYESRDRDDWHHDGYHY